MSHLIQKLQKAYAIACGGFRSFETVVVDDLRLRWPIRQSGQFWQGYHPDATVIKFLIDHFSKGGVFFDIGANVGLYSMALARAAGNDFRGVAFEPCPSTVKCLRENLALNGIRTVLVHEFALSSRTGVMTLSAYPNGLNNFAVSRHDTRHPIVEVPCTTLDDFCANEELLPTLCKIDVEAHELEVLIGAQATLTRCRPLLMIEVHGADVKSTDRDSILRLLRICGYRRFTDPSGGAVQNLPDRTTHLLCKA